MPPLKEQVIHFINKKMPGGLPKKTARALLDIEDADYVPIIRDPQATTPETEAVFYFPGCGSERLFGEVGQAALYILLKAGATVVLPPPALCCGFPFDVNAHSAERKRIELRNAIVFSQIKEMLSYLAFDAVGVSCGTCSEALGHLGAATIFNAPITDVAAWALSQGLTVKPLGEVLYHAPCHDSLNGHAEPVLKLAGGNVRRIPACCGEAGTLALSRPDIAEKLFDRKEGELRTALQQQSRSNGAAVVLTNCPACLQGLGRQERLGITAMHLAVRLAEASNTDWHAELSGLARDAEVVTI
jgi:Fe-S oxidoreductase